MKRNIGYSPEDDPMLDVRNVGRVEFYYKPTFFIEQDGEKRVLNLSYIQRVNTPYTDWNTKEICYPVLTNDGWVHLSKADGERLMKMLEA